MISDRAGNKGCEAEIPQKLSGISLEYLESAHDHAGNGNCFFQHLSF